MSFWSDVDFLDAVVSVFGLIILISLLATHFLGLPETVLTRSLQEWFFAILGFVIGKKGFLPSGRSSCVGCANYLAAPAPGKDKTAGAKQ